MIEETIIANTINYDEIIKTSYIKLYNRKIEYDINVIIPIRNRPYFLDLLIDSLKAAEIPEIKVNYIVIEHSNLSFYITTCFNKQIDYIHIPCGKDDIFNKCLCHNIGVFASKKSKYLLFHDLDCIPQKSFFKNLFENIKDKKARFIQTFNDRRVLTCDEEITSSLLKRSININDLNKESEGIKVSNTGAPGGSICVDYKLFFEIGGFDPELFTGYAPEDQFFWDKAATLTENFSCSNPVNELYHLAHCQQVWDKIYFAKMTTYCTKFRSYNIEEKIKFINFKSNLIAKYNKQTLNDYFDKIYCINLDKREDRWIECVKEFKKQNINVERISGIDGNPDKIISNLTDGAIGCTLSHLQVVAISHLRGLENILILEDDVEFIENINSKFNEYINQVPKDWGLLYFGGNHNNEPLVKVNENVSLVTNTYTTHAYAVNKNLFIDLINIFASINDVCDVLLTDIQKKYKNSYVFQPHLAWQRSGYSDVLNVETDYEFLKTGYNK